MTLKDQIAEFVSKRSRVTVEAIRREFEAARGELWWKSRNFENVVFWQGLSQEAINGLEELLEEKAILMRPASLREYLAGDEWEMLLLPVGDERAPLCGGALAYCGASSRVANKVTLESGSFLPLAPVAGRSYRIAHNQLRGWKGF